MKFLHAISILASGKIGALHKIENKFKGNWQKAWASDLRKFLPVDLNYDMAKKSVNPDKEFEKLAKHEIGLITIHDKEYPKTLKHITDPPFLLYVRGNKTVLKGKCFAVVGTRSVTEYGKRATPAIVQDLVRGGLTIVSGLAVGIDTLAHRSALEEGGKSIAVLGCGLDDRTIFPSQNLFLARKIIETGGAVIGEYSIGIHGTKFSFPQRNRIISGLSRGVLVVEADIKSGSLITANCALDQNRDVFAVPGSIFSKTSRGTNSVIQKGAKLVASGQDILDDYEIYLNKNNVIVRGDNEIENKILSILTNEPLTVDDIIRRTGMSVSEINATLMIMELKKKIKNLNGRFILK